MRAGRALATVIGDVPANPLYLPAPVDGVPQVEVLTSLPWALKPKAVSLAATDQACGVVAG